MLREVDWFGTNSVLGTFSPNRIGVLWAITHPAPLMKGHLPAEVVVHRYGLLCSSILFRLNAHFNLSPAITTQF